MTTLSSNIRTHKILVQDYKEDGKAFVNFHAITKHQYDVLRNSLDVELSTARIDIKDPDTREVLWEGKMSDIKGFREIKRSKNLGDLRKVCKWGTRHTLSEECRCEEKFDCLGFQLIDWLKEKGYEIDYSSDITEKMQKEYLNNHKKNELN